MSVCDSSVFLCHLSAVISHAYVSNATSVSHGCVQNDTVARRTLLKDIVTNSSAQLHSHRSAVELSYGCCRVRTA